MKNKKWVCHFGSISGKRLKKPSGKKRWIAVGLSVVLIGGAACGAFFRFRGRPFQAMAENMEAQSAVVEKGDITTTVVGTGNLANKDAKDVAIPTGIKVEDVLVENGDAVKKGDVLATLDADSIKRAMLDVQEEIEELDDEIEDARDDTASSYITAGVSATVKTIYAKTDKKVSDIMAKKGALMVLVMDDDSETEIAVTGAAGTVSKIYVSEGDEVSAGDNLIYLEDVSESSEYLGLVSERKELAEYLKELSSVAGTNTVTAGFDGTVQDVNVSASTSSDSSGTASSGSTAGGNITAASAKASVDDAGTGTAVSAVQAVSAQGKVTVKSTESTGAAGVYAAVVKYTAETAEKESEQDTEGNTEKETESETQPETEKISINSVKDLVEAPVAGQKPQDSIAETDYYTGEISWSNVTDTFAAGTSYAAEVTLRAKSLDGLQYVFSKDVELSQTGAAVSGVVVSDTVLKYQLTFEKTQEDAGGGTGTQDQTGGSGNTANGGNNSDDHNNENNGNIGNNSNAAGNENNSGNGSNGNGQGTGGNVNQGAGSGGQSGSSGGGVSVSGGTSGYGSSSVSGSAVTVSSSTSGSSDTNETNANMVTAFTISPDESMMISISVDELDILSVAEGQSADVTFDALENQTFTGTITGISNTANVNGGVAKYTVDIEVPKDENMRVGMNASATIKVEDKQDILLLPSIALQERGDSVFVYTEQAEDGTLSGEVEVETGLSDGTNVEIVNGLSEGDTVYYTRVGNDSSESGFGRGERGDFNRGDMPDMGNMPDMGGRGGMTPPNQ